MKKSERGFVYFIQVGSDGPIKIGRTVNPPVGRLIELQTAVPWDLVMRLLIRDAGHEKAIHERFWYLALRGEWFRPHEDLTAFISQLAAGASDKLVVRGKTIPVAPMPVIQRLRDRWDYRSEEERRVGMEQAELATSLMFPMLDELITSVKSAKSVQHRHA